MSVHSLAHHRLVNLYPAIDPLFVAEALGSYETARYRVNNYPIGEIIVYVDDLVTVFRRKIQDMGGVYPTVLPGERIETLNRDLAAVSEAFPFVPQQRLRELVQNPPPNTSLAHSLLYTLPAALLADRHLYTPTAIPQPQPFPKVHRIRTKSYRRHVEAVLLQRFPKLSKLQTRAVSLEVNWDFQAATVACEEIEKALGWAGRMLGGLRAFARPKDKIDLRACPELLEEIEDAERQVRREVEKRDLEVAKEYNREQYRQLGQTIECVCCFEDIAFEDGAACSSGCFVCRGCIVQQVMSRLPTLPTPDPLIDPASSLIGCPAALPPCPGSHIPDSALRTHLAPSTYSLYRKSYLTAQLRPITESNPELSQCPSCSYFELRRLPQLSPFWKSLFLGALWLLSFLVSVRPERHLADLLIKLEISRSTSLLRCPACKTTSCRLCSATVHGLHRCGMAGDPADEAQVLRIAVEHAMADSLKRVCPHCEIAFIKADGCNHMRCPCGGHMCYVCRADIKKDGYKHFCDHFREDAGGRCPVRCGKCELYRNESDAEAANAAAKRVRDEYLGKKKAKEPPLEETILGYMDQVMLLGLGWTAVDS